MIETSSKDVQNRTKPNELNLLFDISEHLNASKIAEKCGYSRGSVTNWLKPLREKGLVKKIGYGTWEITSTGLEQIQKLQGGVATDSEFFYDDVEITYPIELQAPLNFKDGQWNLNKYVSFSQMRFGEWIVRNNNNKSLTIIFPKVYGKDELEPITKVNYWSHQLIEEIVRKFPQIKLLSKIPKLSKAGSLGSTKLNEMMSPILKHVTIRSKDYDADNTPKPAVEFKVKDFPHTSAAKLKETLDFVSSGAYKEEIEGLKEANRIIITELQGLAQTIGIFANTMNEFIEMERKRLEK